MLYKCRDIRFNNITPPSNKINTVTFTVQFVHIFVGLSFCQMSWEEKGVSVIKLKNISWLKDNWAGFCSTKVQLNESYSCVLELGQLKLKLHLRLRWTQRLDQEFLLRDRGLWMVSSNYGWVACFWYFQDFKWTQKRTITPMPTKIDDNMFFTP